MSDKTENKRVKGSVLPWFVSSRVSEVERRGLSEIEQACLALEIEGMPCPMDVDPERWVRSNFAYMCSKYYEAYPQPVVKAAPAKKKKKKFSPGYWPKSQKPNKQRPTRVAGVDVTTTDFLNTYEWRKVRMQALKKYGAKCMCCGATPQTGAVMNVDHIKPRKLFPNLALDINNLQVLCHDCNHGKGNWDHTDWR